MPTLDLEKTNYKFRDVIWAIGLIVFLVGIAYRFESNVSETNDKIDSLEQKMMYKYELEILKINNRIDLLEAKKYALRKDFKNDSTIIKGYIAFIVTEKTNKKQQENKRYPQVCMIVPRHPECQKKRFLDLKKLV